MKTPIIRTVLMSIVAGLIVASVGLASAGTLGFVRASDTEKATVNPESSTTKAKKPRGGEVAAKPAQPADPAEREAECNEAAGMSTAGDGEGSDATVAGEATEEKKTGLDHAIEVVLANCIKNPQAPGLVNALRHLVVNRDRHLAREAAKAERRAAREAAKAARRAAKGHGKGSD